MQAQIVQRGELVTWTADAAYSSGDVIQLRDGRAGVVSVDVASGAQVGVYVAGIFKVAKTTSMYMLHSSKIFWDHSADKAHLLHGGDRDFFMGTCVEDAGSAAATVLVNLNVQPVFTSGFEGGWAPTRIQTAGFVSAVGAGREGVNLDFSATAEAQTAAALAHNGFVITAEGIAHFLVCVNDNGDDAALDIDWGVSVASGTTDWEAITQRVGFHLDGNTLDLDAGSDNGTTDTGLIDTTVNIVEGTPFLCQLDLRNPSDILAYVNGVRVLDGTTGAATTLAIAAGTFKAIAFMEKTANDTPGGFSVLYGGVVTAQV